MASDDEVLHAVCRIASGKKLKARQLVHKLRGLSIDLARSDLNRLLYRHLPSVPGLTVSDGYWSFEEQSSLRSPSAVDRRLSLGDEADDTTKPHNDPNTSGFDFDPDEEQKRVIEKDVSARILVEAGPGTGKTAIACLRIARLVNEQDVNPSKVLVITFTRTAVAEIRSRLHHYMNADAASQVAISTIDSSAWRFEAIALSGSRELESYDATIQSALSHMRQHDASILDLVEGLEHVIIDEAQDVTGIRSEFVVELVRSLSSACGVTIFADPYQSIYGFTLEGNQVAIENPVEILRRELLSFEYAQLGKAHRFSPELEYFIGNARSIAADEELSGAERQEELANAIREASSELPRDLTKIANALKGNDNALLLCRWRREVIQASSFFLSEKVPHRLRLPGFPDSIHPWVSRVFSHHVESTIDEQTFKSRFNELCSPTLDHELGADEAWEQVFRLARARGGKTDVTKLRRVLSRSRPPVELCFLDGSPSGPILGTIHASKGREADQVFLLVPRALGTTDPEEESRVLYVAATRARSRLSAVNAISAWGDTWQETGRCFKFEKKSRSTPPYAVRLEIGVNGDLHEAMTVSDRINATEDTARQTQELLWKRRAEVCCLRAERSSRGEEYRLWFDESELQNVIGSLSRRVIDDARAIARSARCQTSGQKLYHLYGVGACTFVLGADSRELEHVCEPYRSTGFFLAPIVRGYSLIYTKESGE